ncbi:hypothetical protein [Gimesia maris]|uniref:hypothetical protein n=1 Tax=Gimesia maris TaxID=122 RepID=UPI0012B8153B|nr:hypothetical protein [Gimesia maris]
MQQRTRAGLQQRTRSGLQQRTFLGLQQRTRTGLQHFTRSGLQQRLRKPNASASETLKEAAISVRTATKESVTVFRIMVYSSDSINKSGSTSLKDESLLHPPAMSPSLRTWGKQVCFSGLVRFAGYGKYADYNTRTKCDVKVKTTLKIKFL